MVDGREPEFGEMLRSLSCLVMGSHESIDPRNTDGLRKKNIIQNRNAGGGTQVLYKFPNGYGASVVQTDCSYGGNRGLWEIAVLTWDEDEYDITYDTPITKDVIGWLTPLEVNDVLEKIELLEVD